MKLKSKLGWASFCIGLVLFVAGTAGSSQLLAQDVTVTEAIPNTAAQGTINLNVTIKGGGYKKGARAQWFITGTTNPGGITVNSTTFVSGNELLANITVAADAQTQFKLDIYVTSGGRTGKGIELFSVSSSGNTACTAPATILTGPVNCFLSSGGCLDTTFGVNGLALTDTPGTGGAAIDVVIQSDGKIVAAGRSTDPNTGTDQDFALVRYSADGTLDTTFGTAGVARLPISSTQELRAAVVQPDDKIVVAGENGGYYMVARFNPNGSLDTGFGAGGTMTMSFPTGKGIRKGGGGYASGLALQPDGKILVVGTSWHIARLNPDGSLDSTFGIDGKVTLLDQMSFGGAWTVALQPVQAGTTTENRILLGGNGAGNFGSDSDFALIRLTPSDSIDTSFGPSANGVVMTNFCGEVDVVRAIAFDSSGNILAAGQLGYDNGHTAFAIARYSPNGILDTSYGDPSSGTNQPGKTMVSPMGPTDPPTTMAVIAYSILVQPDGKSVLTGRVYVAGDPYMRAFWGMARLTEDGMLDTSFGTGGVVVSDFSPGSNTGWKGRLQSDGKILAVGSVDANGTYNFGVARFWP